MDKKISHGQNVTWTKCHMDEISHVQNITRLKRRTKCHMDKKMSHVQNVTGHRSNCHMEKMSHGQNVTRPKCPWTRCHRKKCHTHKCHTVNMSKENSLAGVDGMRHHTSGRGRGGSWGTERYKK